MTGQRIGYTRVSSLDQQVARQLEGIALDRTFTDTASGKDTKRPQLESKDQLKRRIDEAAKYVPLDQLCLSGQCGFSSTVEGNALSVDDEIAKLRLIVETAAEVWG